ncbi:MAG TPA: KpsF/GutQ family sugar-phosphate isomerase [Planctomycetota bacterium]
MAQKNDERLAWPNDERAPDARPDMDFARQVLRSEARAVASLEERVNGDFMEAAKRILALSAAGRVVVSGMGKAGIIAQKIAATFASTGTPALFMHPAEAVHGDLGMVTAQDVVLAFSNSGETDELLRLLPTLKQIRCQLIALTSARASTLGRAADLVLEIGHIEEPCPLRMAPSASTTAMLALGDALALTVLKARGFTQADYAKLHPAGALGRRVMPVTEAMRHGERMVKVGREVTIAQAMEMMARPPRNGAAVIADEAGKLVGIFTHGDFGRLVLANPQTIHEQIGQHMTSPCKSIRGSALVLDAQQMMHQSRINALPVVDESNTVLGLLDIQDLV